MSAARTATRLAHRAAVDTNLPLKAVTGLVAARAGLGERRGAAVAALAARAVIGGLFIGHGTQKLFGWFGGPGPDGAAQMMDRLQLAPARRHALLAGATETGAGALLAAGAATPLATAGLVGVMASAIRTVHLKNGPWAANGGYEYNLVLIAALLAITESGPGLLSVDHVAGSYRHGTRWALAALGIGLAASELTLRYGRRRAAADDSYPQAPAAVLDERARPQG